MRNTKLLDKQASWKRRIKGSTLKTVKNIKNYESSQRLSKHSTPQGFTWAEQVQDAKSTDGSIKYFNC